MIYVDAGYDRRGAYSLVIGSYNLKKKRKLLIIYCISDNTQRDGPLQKTLLIYRHFLMVAMNLLVPQQ